MAEDLGWEIRLYQNTPPSPQWVQQDILSEYKGFNFVKVVNQTGSGSITFDIKNLNTTNQALLNRDVFFAFCKPAKYGEDTAPIRGTDICFGILPENITHSILGPNNHEVKISGPGLGELLNRSVVLPAGYSVTSTGPDQRELVANRPLDVWADMMAEADVRQSSSILVPPFSGFGGIKITDSSGLGWDPATIMNINFVFKAGIGLLDLLKWAHSFGGFDFMVDLTQRNPVQAYTYAYQGLRADVTGKVGLHLGRHVLSADRVTSREQTMSNLYGALSRGLTRPSVFNGAAQLQYGKREFYWTEATEYFDPEAQQVATKLANARMFANNTTTLQIAPNLDFKAFIDYDVFDQITYDNLELGIRGSYIVKGIAVDVQGQDERQEILLETPMESFQRRVYSELNRDQQIFKFNTRSMQ